MNSKIVVDDARKVGHLHSLDGAKERLHLFPANLLEEGSFDAAVEGCECVFHTASPFYIDPTDPEVWKCLQFFWLNFFNFACYKLPRIVIFFSNFNYQKLKLWL